MAVALKAHHMKDVQPSTHKPDPGLLLRRAASCCSSADGGARWRGQREAVRFGCAHAPCLIGLQLPIASAASASRLSAVRTGILSG